jgi:hypothetical protein
MMHSLWATMDKGRFSPALGGDVLHFNGGLFEHTQAIPLDEEQLELLISAAEADWSAVEPAIFGTLLERALDARERERFGAHYTPRAYVERLVLPTIIEPLRADWEAVKAAAVPSRSRSRCEPAPPGAALDCACLPPSRRHPIDRLSAAPARGSSNRARRGEGQLRSSSFSPCSSRFSNRPMSAWLCAKLITR